MKDFNSGLLSGIVTDRDIIVRVLGMGLDPQNTKVYLTTFTTLIGVQQPTGLLMRLCNVRTCPMRNICAHTHYAHAHTHYAHAHTHYAHAHTDCAHVGCICSSVKPYTYS